MKNKFFITVFIFSLLLCLDIQTTTAQTLDWVRTTGSFDKQGVMIARDANDNVASCGYLIHDRIFTRKWDKFGNFLWEQESVSGIFNYRERPTWITTDNSNNIITLGYRYYGTSFQQPNAIVVLKYAPDGTLLFKKTIEGVVGPQLRCELDPTGNIYIGCAATITGQSDFGFNLIKLDPNGNILFISIHNFGSYYGVNNMRYRNGYIALTGITSLQGFSFNCTIALFDANGNYLWGVVSSSLYTGIDVEVDNGGNVYVVNKGFASGLDDDIVVTKYSVTGTVLFTYYYDNNSHYETPSRINIQPDGNFVISGVSTSPVTGLETFKLSSTGSLMWEAFYSTPFPDIPELYFLATNMNTGDVFITGTTSISGNPASIFTVNYDSFGNESWAAQYDSTATRGMGLAVASDGSVFVVGRNWWTILHYLDTTAGATDIVLNLKAFLEGPFNGINMNAILNSGGLLPLSQPYNMPPWNYAGTENVAVIPNTNVVDWVLVELRDAVNAGSATIGTRIARQAAFIMNDGSITAMDGISDLIFNVTITNNLFAIVWHKNHLGVMSALPLTLAGGLYSFDFTTGSGQAYGGVNAHKQLAAGKWGMFSGDGDGNGTVNTNDKTLVWTINAGKTGYFASDFNLDRQTNNKDKNEKWFPNLSKVSLVP